MQILDLTLPSPGENLALEEALLEQAESREEEYLRLWESPEYFVVLGAGSPAKTDVNIPACQERSIPILRRMSGGGTVLQGPGCLNYTLLLDRETRPEIDSIASTNQVVLETVRAAVRESGCPEPEIQGISDLTMGPLKFSGNAQRRRKRFILYHGTILHGFDLNLISQCLGAPEKMPEYRAGRPHGGFVTNIDVNAALLRRCIAEQWNAQDELKDWPQEQTKKLARTKYADQHWIMSI